MSSVKISESDIIWIKVFHRIIDTVFKHKQVIALFFHCNIDPLLLGVGGMIPKLGDVFGSQSGQFIWNYIPLGAQI